MRFCRFSHPRFAAPRYATLDCDELFFSPDDDQSLEEFLRAAPAAAGEGGGRAALSLPLAAVRLLAPVAPSKIVCVGRNYRDHAAELGNPMPVEPLLFLKPPSALIAHGESIILPRESDRIEHEGEVAVVIGRRARRLGTGDDPFSYVAGYTCLNDVTARDLQRRDVQFTRAKSFDTFCPVGPVVVSGLDPLDISVETRVNGTIRQQGRTGAMAFPIDFLIRYISQVMTLEPGDLIATGTPAGVDALRDGDIVEIEVGGVGVLRNFVRTIGAEEEARPGAGSAVLES